MPGCSFSCILCHTQGNGIQQQHSRHVSLEDSYAAQLRRCGDARSLEDGKRLHSRIAATRHDKETYIGNLLVQMYGKCGSLEDARAVFDGILLPNVFSWNILIGAYAQNGHPREVLHLFLSMTGLSSDGAVANHITYIGALGACASLGALAEGRQVHAEIVRSGFDSHVLVGNSLITMYGKCGSLDEAQSVFSRMPRKDVASWNALMAAYVQNGDEAKALALYRQMGIAADRITFTTVLGACSNLGLLAEGKELHQEIAATKLNSDVAVATALLSMYGKCGSLHDAASVFGGIQEKNVVSWTAMIAAYAQNGHGKDALKLKRAMGLDGIKPNSVTFWSILDACSLVGSLPEGKLAHACIISSGLEADTMVATALIDMYGKCGSLDDARAVFGKLHSVDVIPWNAMIAACSQNGCGRNALQLFREMDQEGIKLDRITFLHTLDACCHIGAVAEAKGIHARIVDVGLESDPYIGNSLVNLYDKCGSLDNAKFVFDRLKSRDAISWSSLIAAYARQGQHKEVPALSWQMHLEGVKANDITFVNILYACSHAGLVNEGCLYFTSMLQDHGIPATAEHYGCMVDLLGRAGWLLEAEDLIANMPFQPDAVTWTSLLNACKIHSDTQRARLAAEHAHQLEAKDLAAPYVAFSNIYTG